MLTYLFQALIRHMMRELMGVKKYRTSDGTWQMTLPAPLPPGSMPRTVQEGSVRLYNPEWEESYSHPTNDEFLHAVVSQILDNEKVRLFYLQYGIYD